MVELKSMMLESAAYQQKQRAQYTPGFFMEKFGALIKKQDIQEYVENTFLFSCEIAESLVTDIETNKNIHNKCLKGCSHCCTQPIQILESERIVIINKINRDFSPEDKRKIKHKIKQFQKDLRSNVGAVKYTSKFRQDYLKQGLYCPFLGEDGACSIYDSRPINCRTYYEYLSPESCERQDYSDTSIAFEDAQFTIFFMLKNALIAYAEYHGIDYIFLWDRYVNKNNIELLPFSVNTNDF